MAKAERNAFLYSTGRLISELPPELLIPKKFDPKLVKPIRILHYYPGLKHEVECVYGHLHKEGAVCLFQDGQIGPVGQECVKKYFGEAAWLDIKKNWNVQINAEYAESRIAPSLHRFARLQAALPPFADILKVRDNFFYRLDALAEKFYGRLRGVVLETGFGVSAMSTNSGLRFNECLDSIEKARLQYNAAKVTKKNLVKGEELYQQERNYIRNKFIPELRATETFFQPTSIDRYIKTIQQDNYWKHRTKLQGDKLLLCLRQDDWREFNIPHQLPGQIAGMSEFLHEIEDAIK